MNVLIVGNGGREHALAWKVAQSPLVTQVWVAPGNAGTAKEPKCQNINIAPTDIDALMDFAKKTPIALTIVGPEAPLSAGIVDQFLSNDLPCFGPTQAAAQLESSKSFSKDFMKKTKIPTADYGCFTDKNAALAFLDTQTLPIVIKASGLAAGKGVIIAETKEIATNTIVDILDNQRFGHAGNEIIIESFLEGEELSYIVMVDGEHITPFASSQDHKRRDDGDLGPNTGGMGAYSPAPILTPSLEQKIMNEVMIPAVQQMAADGTPYTGFLYAGIMVSPTDEPKVLEFNCRMGDPETQPLLYRLKSDLVPLCLSALSGTLNEHTLEWSPEPAVAVVMASGGYPDQYEKNHPITGLDSADSEHTKVFHAGTAMGDNGNVLTQGGRVLAVTASDTTLGDAVNLAYKTIDKISWQDCFYRKDIAHRALKPRPHKDQD